MSCHQNLSRYQSISKGKRWNISIPSSIINEQTNWWYIYRHKIKYHQIRKITTTN